ncbi:hypothetical protein CVT25_004877, partial [Psilocybe cyanescens]
MEEEYKLNMRDTLVVAEQILSMPEFEGKIDMVPYKEYDLNGNQAYSNLNSGIWANQQADKIAADPLTHGAIFVPIIAGSDKTTVSVATGHQDYHPVYMSPGPIMNTARHGHGNGVVPIGFLPIPKR